MGGGIGESSGRPAARPPPPAPLLPESACSRVRADGLRKGWEGAIGGEEGASLLEGFGGLVERHCVGGHSIEESVVVASHVWRTHAEGGGFGAVELWGRVTRPPHGSVKRGHKSVTGFQPQSETSGDG